MNSSKRQSGEHPTDALGQAKCRVASNGAGWYRGYTTLLPLRAPAVEFRGPFLFQGSASRPRASAKSLSLCKAQAVRWASSAVAISPARPDKESLSHISGAAPIPSVGRSLVNRRCLQYAYLLRNYYSIGGQRKDYFTHEYCVFRNTPYNCNVMPSAL